jgi:hypothetical protein
MAFLNAPSKMHSFLNLHYFTTLPERWQLSAKKDASSKKILGEIKGTETEGYEETPMKNVLCVALKN